MAVHRWVNKRLTIVIDSKLGKSANSLSCINSSFNFAITKLLKIRRFTEFIVGFEQISDLLPISLTLLSFNFAITKLLKNRHFSTQCTNILYLKIHYDVWAGLIVYLKMYEKTTTKTLLLYFIILKTWFKWKQYCLQARNFFLAKPK